MEQGHQGNQMIAPTILALLALYLGLELMDRIARLAR